MDSIRTLLKEKHLDDPIIIFDMNEQWFCSGILTQEKKYIASTQDPAILNRTEMVDYLVQKAQRLTANHPEYRIKKVALSLNGALQFHQITRYLSQKDSSYIWVAYSFLGN